jgi:hypothetical protein
MFVYSHEQHYYSTHDVNIHMTNHKHYTYLKKEKICFRHHFIEKETF